jgi:hypothetical protein
MERAESFVHPDGQCDGDGFQWPPALSADPHWVWDGSRWEPVASARRKWKQDGRRMGSRVPQACSGSKSLRWPLLSRNEPLTMGSRVHELDDDRQTSAR